MAGKPVSSIPPWLLHHFLLPGSCLDLLPWLPMVIQYDPEVEDESTLSSTGSFWSWCFSQQQKPDLKGHCACSPPFPFPHMGSTKQGWFLSLCFVFTQKQGRWREILQGYSELIPELTTTEVQDREHMRLFLLHTSVVSLRLPRSSRLPGNQLQIQHCYDLPRFHNPLECHTEFSKMLPSGSPIFTVLFPAPSVNCGWL